MRTQMMIVSENATREQWHELPRPRTNYGFLLLSAGEEEKQENIDLASFCRLQTTFLSLNTNINLQYKVNCLPRYVPYSKAMAYGPKFC